jgi:hypothetical protein
MQQQQYTDQHHHPEISSTDNSSSLTMPPMNIETDTEKMQRKQKIMNNSEV